MSGPDVHFGHGLRNVARGLARVDIGQIRKQLRLPLKERPRVVADAANVLLSVQEHARRSRSAEAG